MENLTQTPAVPDVAEEAISPANGLDLTGRTLGEYRVLRRLGQGGMGQVYLAEQISLKRKVALKILRSDLASNPTALQRFKSEAESIARATHANIVQVYHFGESNGLYYMALEYVEGRNLAEYLARKGTPDLLLALSIMRQVASALQRASELGIIHRDIKPENILLTRKGEVKVADFGLSRCFGGDQQALRLTQSGVTMGTPLYMSPEQVEGRPLDPRADIYSFGVTCYNMFAGHPPFRGETAIEVALKHVNAEPDPLSEVRPDLPVHLCEIIHKMMAKAPADRYQTGGEILKDMLVLRDQLGGAISGSMIMPAITLGDMQSSAAQSLAATTRLPEPRRSKLPWAVVASLLLALAAGAALGFWKGPALGIGPTGNDGASSAQTGNKDGTQAKVVGDVSSLPAQPGSGDARPPESIPDAKRSEQALQELVKQHLNSKDRGQITTGLGLSQELALLYLDQNRLEEADTLFGQMEATKQQEYRDFGHLGHAIVLAFKGDWETSNKKFQDWIGDRQVQEGHVRYLRGNQQMKQVVFKAFQQNEKHTPNGKLPDSLEHFKRSVQNQSPFPGIPGREKDRPKGGKPEGKGDRPGG